MLTESCSQTTHLTHSPPRLLHNTCLTPFLRATGEPPQGGTQPSASSQLTGIAFQMGNPSVCSHIPSEYVPLSSSCSCQRCSLDHQEDREEGKGSGWGFLARSTQIFPVWKGNADTLVRAEHSPFLDLPPCLPARGGPSSPTSPVDVDALQKPGHRPCSSSQPLPLFPSIDGTPSTPRQPPPAFSPAHHLQALLVTSGSDTNSHLPGKCRQPRAPPPQLLCHM